MITGLRTAAEAATALDALLSASAILAPAPAPWQTLMVQIVTKTADILRHDNEYDPSAPEVLSLTIALARVGRHVAWGLARVDLQDLITLQWQAMARWHHDVFTVTHAGWRRRISVGVNRAWPLEINQMEPIPQPVRVTETAARWIELLGPDPLNIPVDQATLALQIIPAGVWISP